jgi:hypothetical protein
MFDGQLGDGSFSGGINYLPRAFAADVTRRIDTWDGGCHFCVGDDESGVIRTQLIQGQDLGVGGYADKNENAGHFQG